MRSSVGVGVRVKRLSKGSEISPLRKGLSAARWASPGDWASWGSCSVLRPRKLLVKLAGLGKGLEFACDYKWNICVGGGGGQAAVLVMSAGSLLRNAHEDGRRRVEQR
jgi:hypothetical protein